MFLGRWYGEWRREQDDLLYEEDEEDEDEDMESEASYETSDDEDEDEDEEEMDRQSSATSVLPEDKMDLDDLESLEDLDMASSGSGLSSALASRSVLDLPRGRTRNTRRLGHATSDPTLQASVPSMMFQSFSSLPRTQSQ